MLSTHTGPAAVRVWAPALTEPACRLCGARLHRTLIDLGPRPLANRTIGPDEPDEPCHRLHARICDNCTLVQLTETAEPQPPSRPSPPSQAALAQIGRHAEILRRRLHLSPQSLVIEIGARDASLLQGFQSAAIRVCAIQPLAVLPDTIPTSSGPFNTETAMEIAVRHGCADLVIANDVVQRAPDLFDFAAGLASILRPNGVLAIEVPHLLALIQKLQFDAFRHDSCTYLSLRVLEHVLRSVGLRVFDAERLPDRGGSLRIHACHVVGPHAARPGLKTVRLAETFGERERRDFYTGFSARAAAARDEIRDFIQTRRAAGRRVAAYGAVIRGTTLLNACGLTTREIDCVADPDPNRQGRLLPGCRIPIVPPETLLRDPPDDILILPWTSAAEAVLPLHPLRQAGTQLWTPLPRIARV